MIKKAYDYEVFSLGEIDKDYTQELECIAHAWGNYLNYYCIKASEHISTSSGIETPFNYVEETCVGSLVSAIHHGYPKALSLIELPITKKGNHSQGGKADLWVSINGGKQGIYIESKLKRLPKSIEQLETTFIGRKSARGLLSLGVRDAQKTTGQLKRLHRATPDYPRVMLLMLRLTNTGQQEFSALVKNSLSSIYKKQKIYRNSISANDATEVLHDFSKHINVGLLIKPTKSLLEVDPEHCGFLAVFTVLQKSKQR